MKLIDKEGRIFSKINILDFIFIILVFFVLVLSLFKVLDKDFEDFAKNDEYVHVEVETSIIIDKGYLDVIKPGDKLGETKQYLDGSIVQVEILPLEVTNLDKDGNTVVSIDPLMEKAKVIFEANVPYGNMSYKFGKQEIRQGKVIFLESDFYRHKAQIESVKVVK